MKKRWSLSRLVALFLVSALALVAAGCDQDDAAMNTGKALATSKATWETTQRQVAQAYLDGKITDAQWSKFCEIDGRYRATHNAAVEAYRIYLQAKDRPDDLPTATHLMNIALANVLTVLQEGLDLARAWGVLK